MKSIYNSTITNNILRDFIHIKGVRISYKKDTRTIRITHREYEAICDINQWLLDYFPRYLNNIDYGGCYDKTSWLEISCIDK